MMNLYDESIHRIRHFSSKKGKLAMENVLKVPVTIKWRLAAVMADREIDNQKLHEVTGLHLGTISKLRNKKPARLDTNTLDALCKALRCEPGELLRFIPDDEGDQGAGTEQLKTRESKTEKKPVDNKVSLKRQSAHSLIAVVPNVLESA